MIDLPDLTLPDNEYRAFIQDKGAASPKGKVGPTIHYYTMESLILAQDER